jgi:TfoX/Sxy family transcriptional regulator of competence genes
MNSEEKQEETPRRWNKPSPELQDIIEQAVGKYTCTMKKMFGSNMFFVNNNMWTGVHQNRLILRMGEEDRGAILRSHSEVAMFEPMPGRIMTEYIDLPEQLVRDETFLSEWLERSHTFVASLPLKPPRMKKHTKK